MKRIVELVIIGAGNRGRMYADYAKTHPDRASVVAVAEPRQSAREALALEHSIPRDRTFTEWQQLANQPRLADAVVVATQDSLHVEPALAFSQLGYHLLLEKPMAQTERDCQLIVESVQRHGVMLGVAHVLRYTPFTKALREVLDRGAIGDIVSLQRLEPVGYWHQAHSYVRGNWRSSAEGSPMLLAKACHDLDWISYIMNEPCVSISSFGSLNHFRRDRKPAAAGDATRCLDCDYEPKCPYSARHIYLERALRQEPFSLLSVVSDDVSVEGLTAALEDGPYGRCVYECDNDVVDHQVVIMEFESGRSASFTMTAFTEAHLRYTRLFGTRGELRGDGHSFEIFDFLSDSVETFGRTDSSVGRYDASTGHGGGDAAFVEAFIGAVSTDDPSLLLSGPEETLASHRLVFAAERARRTKTIVDPRELPNDVRMS